MSGRKSNLKQYQNITNGDMSLASITSAVTNIEFLDNVGIQLYWTGSRTGTFQIQVSVDYNQDNNGNVMNAGHWNALNLGTTLDTSVGSPIYVNLQQISAPWLRVVFTRTGGSGAGTLNSWLSAKML